MQTALLLVPEFALIAIGILLMRFARLEPAFWLGLERLVYFLLFPALLFYSIARTPFDFTTTTRLAQTGVAVIATGIALGWAARLVKLDGLVWASTVQCAFRFNSYIALALAGRLGGEAGVASMAILVGIGVPLCNAAAVFALARHSERGLLTELARNPLLIATLAGVIFNLLGFRLPDPIAGILSRLGSASIALGLIAVGAGLKLAGAHEAKGLVAWITTVKLVVLPAVALVVGRALGVHGVQLQIVVLFAALPTASSAYILAQRMGGHGALVAVLISLGTVLSAVTIPVWMNWVQIVGGR
ncbi:MAG TPA: AEC family transporter [Burkholderiaceae bacterium]|nr:AEC family transporter [Burkholderiaceae bacterium]